MARSQPRRLTQFASFPLASLLVSTRLQQEMQSNAPSSSAAPQYPSPLSAQLAPSVPESTSTSFSPSGAPPLSQQPLATHPYFHNAPTTGQRTEQEEEVAELEQYRQQALQHKSAIEHGSQFQPFEGSRVGSPIPDNNGLGWPGTSLLSCSATSPFR